MTLVPVNELTSSLINDPLSWYSRLSNSLYCRMGQVGIWAVWLTPRPPRPNFCRKTFHFPTEKQKPCLVWTHNEMQALTICVLSLLLLGMVDGADKKTRSARCVLSGSNKKAQLFFLALFRKWYLILEIHM